MNRYTRYFCWVPHWPPSSVHSTSVFDGVPIWCCAASPIINHSMWEGMNISPPVMAVNATVPIKAEKKNLREFCLMNKNEAFIMLLPMELSQQSYQSTKLVHRRLYPIYLIQLTLLKSDLVGSWSKRTRCPWRIHSVEFAPEVPVKVGRRGRHLSVRRRQHWMT